MLLLTLTLFSFLFLPTPFTTVFKVPDVSTVVTATFSGEIISNVLFYNSHMDSFPAKERIS